MITAEKIYRSILEMPVKEREKLFAVIARRGFEKELYRHDEVFDEIRQEPFTLKQIKAIFSLSNFNRLY